MKEHLSLHTSCISQPERPNGACSKNTDRIQCNSWLKLNSRHWRTQCNELSTSFYGAADPLFRTWKPSNWFVTRWQMFMHCCCCCCSNKCFDMQMFIVALWQLFAHNNGLLTDNHWPFLVFFNFFLLFNYCVFFLCFCAWLYFNILFQLRPERDCFSELLWFSLSAPVAVQF